MENEIINVQDTDMITNKKSLNDGIILQIAGESIPQLIDGMLSLANRVYGKAYEEATKQYIAEIDARIIIDKERIENQKSVIEGYNLAVQKILDKINATDDIDMVRVLNDILRRISTDYDSKLDKTSETQNDREKKGVFSLFKRK
jgi:hypothetical protein